MGWSLVVGIWYLYLFSLPIIHSFHLQSPLHYFTSELLFFHFYFYPKEIYACISGILRQQLCYNNNIIYYEQFFFAACTLALSPHPPLKRLLSRLGYKCLHYREVEFKL